MVLTKEELNYLLDSLITRFLSSVTKEQIEEFKTKYPKFNWEENKNRGYSKILYEYPRNKKEIEETVKILMEFLKVHGKLVPTWSR